MSTASTSAHSGSHTRPDGDAGSRRRPPLHPIPDSDLLQPEDLGGAEPRRLEDDFGRHLRPPVPGGPQRYPSLLLRRADGAILVDYPVGDFHTIVIEYVTAFRGAGAAAYLRELRMAMRTDGCADETGRWTVEESDVAGPRSLLVRLRQEIEDPSGSMVEKDSYLAVARSGGTVVVLADIGWEMGSGRRDTVLGLIDAALRRAGR